MKQLLNKKYIIFSIFIGVLLSSLVSCEEEIFGYDILATHSDGIQNLDETGIDCGGSSGVNCPTCSDGIKNGGETDIDCGGPNCPKCPDATPRADALKSSALPYYYTFESGQVQSGKGLIPMFKNPDGTAYGQGVDAFYGEKDPLGSGDAVTKIVRPSDGRFGGYEDFKFQAFTAPIDFSIYHKWTMDVFIPTGQDFSGALLPQVVLILHDYKNGNFYERWTEIPITIDKADFGKWVTLKFDGTSAAAAGSGVLLPAQTTYTNISLRFGGGGHTKSGIFYVKDLVPTTQNFNTSTTPRADALSKLGLPYYFTFEAVDAGSKLKPFSKNADGSNYTQGVDVTYGDANPAGPATDLVAKVVRPSDGRFGGYEDFKFQTFTAPIDFSVYHKWKMNVFIPSGQNFTGGLVPEVVLILHDYINGNFYERWTQIPITIDAADFGKWVTLTFDGTTAAAAGSGVLLPAQTTYTNISLRFGGAGHTKSGIFYVKDFVPFK